MSERGAGGLELKTGIMRGRSVTRWFRPSIAWLMFAVAVLAADCALLRAPGGQDDVSIIRYTGLVLMFDILAIGLFRIFTRRYESHRVLVRFEISGLVVIASFVLAPYLKFCEPVVSATDRGIGAVCDRLIGLFWHPLSDFDRGDLFGRFLTFVILVLVPAMLLTMLLSALSLVGVVKAEL
jgi:hypothetical protein